MKVLCFEEDPITKDKLIRIEKFRCGSSSINFKWQIMKYLVIILKINGACVI